MKSTSLLALLILLGLCPCVDASPTEILPLSGMGEKDEPSVYWDFMLDSGRGSGKWSRIAVPSCWEQQGFGRYYYGTQGRGKPEDDPVIPKETGTYKRSFEIPANWRDRDVHLVFEAAMTDTSVHINGRSAGPAHQGGFYRFSYDITRLVKPGSNQIEVRVSKESANTSVNHAERRGDYWTFGGIYRPVWLEARPRNHIAWSAIDARADGSFRAQLHFDAPVPRNAQVVAQLFDAGGKAVGAPLRAAAGGQDQVEVSGRFPSPATWSAETPHLYAVKFSLQLGTRPLHEVTQRFGFRTLEVRANDGIYLNGRKIVLKGVNRHSFRPATGRTLTREENYADARLIKDMNMNAVRMSHYPPDPSFLEAADELGLYVLNELAGWQGFYDTPTGARLIGQIVRRDVNHPSILFWDNGNEGGWNTANDGEFARWDLQRRPVLHPWAVHSDINSDHYERYDSTVKLSQGPQIFMPTEFLHGLYDGGIGAGFEDYWRVMGASPTVAGGFFWAFADEGIERTDQDRRIDNVGNAAPDGIVGPNHEKEGSFFTVQQIWSPVQISALQLDPGGALRMKLRNEYDFTDLASHEFHWSVNRAPEPGTSGSTHVIDQGVARGAALPPRKAMDWSIDGVGKKLAAGDIVQLVVTEPSGRMIGRGTLATPAAARPVQSEGVPITHSGLSVSAGEYTLTFSADGRLTRMRSATLEIPLDGPTLMAWVRDGRKFRPLLPEAKVRSFKLAPRGERNVLAQVQYASGGLRSLTWRLDGDELRLSYELEQDGDVDILGIRFAFPESELRGKRWLGAGPYRVWKNRMAGNHFGLWEALHADPIPGETYQYPEFPGFFGEWRWLEMFPERPLARVIFRNVSAVPFFGLHRPQPGKQPVIELPDLGWSFLHVIPPIGTKFDLAETLGPQSQVTRLDGGVIRGEIAIRLAPLH
jgi:hypothetical protein